MVGLLNLLQRKGIHGRSTIFCYRGKESMVVLLFCYRGKGFMVGLLSFATEESKPTMDPFPL
jgi:hypothetical protein